MHTEEWDNPNVDKKKNLTNLQDVEEDIIDKFGSLLPINLDLKSILHQEATKTTNSTIINQKLNVPLYFNSYVDVITNPNVSDGGVYIDEKIYDRFLLQNTFYGLTTYISSW